MIRPTPGRIVWYWPSDSDAIPKFKGEAQAAIVTRVIGDREVNLFIFRGDAIFFTRLNVPLLQDGDERPYEGGFCEWMPFQKGQAMKTEALEASAKR